MKKFLFVFLMCLVFGGVGFYFGKSKDPYRLDYNKIAVDAPVPLVKDFDNDEIVTGEKYLAKDLEAELEKFGFEVESFSWEDTYSNRNFGEGIEIVMRAWPELRLPIYHDFVDSDRIMVLYETVPYKIWEVKNADLVFTGSKTRNEMFNENGIKSYFVPQFTRADKFYPAYNEKYKSRLLFVGNKWPDKPNRKTVLYALRNGFDIDIYGNGWDEVLTDEFLGHVKKKQLKNEDLKYYYSSADIVFNDTREDMREKGFVSNRIFDVTACGGFLISDYVKEIEEIYGDSIPMYKNEEEFVELVNYYLANPQERKEKAKRAQKITIENFEAKVVIGKMAEILRQYVEDRKDLKKGIEGWLKK